jgi:hypothetical protein
MNQKVEKSSSQSVLSTEDSLSCVVIKLMWIEKPIIAKNVDKRTGEYNY